MRNDPAGAELLLNQAIAIRKKELPSGHPAIISAEVRLGEGLIDEGKPAEAEKILRQALAETCAVPFPLAPWHMAEAEIALGAAGDTRLSPEAEHLLHDPESRLRGIPIGFFGTRSCDVRKASIKNFGRRKVDWAQSGPQNPRQTWPDAI